MKEDKKPRKKYNHVSLPCLIEDLRRLLPSPLPGRQGWKPLSMEKWAKRYDVSTKTLQRWLKALEVALYAIPQWVVWKYGPIDRRTGKPKKVLLSAKPSATNAYAKCNDPLTWTSYAQAQARLEDSPTWKVPLQGVAFALNKNGIVILNLDHCIHDGMIDAWAQDIVDAINSYTELSPSGTGVHIIAYGSIPANVNHNGVEMYDCFKFMPVTGKHLSGTPTTIEYLQEQLDTLYAEIALEQLSLASTVSTTCQLSDDDVLEKAKNAENCPKFTLLFSGDWKMVRNRNGSQRYRPPSEADQALCEMLVYWTGNDVSMMNRLFRQSGLYVRNGIEAQALASPTVREQSDRRSGLHKSATLGKVTLQVF